MKFLLCFLFFMACLGAEGQVQDSTAVPVDTTVIQVKAPAGQIEGEIKYEALSIDNWMTEKKTVLVGNARVTYLDMELRAAKITVDWENETMTAEGVLDSVWIQNENGDSVRVEKLTGLPEFTEAGELITGEVMVYNFNTRKGRVLRGRTQYEDGYYVGDALKMVKPRVLNVADAHYTTCDRTENPHFHFRSSRMKIMVNDKVIAKPIVLYLGHIPVLALPFIYFPIERGRHSGIVLPRYGVSSEEGRYLRGFGYYWAASDYWDLKGSLSYFEKSGFLFRGDLNYHLRYSLRGSLSGSWTRKDFEYSGQSQRLWDLSVQHDQTLSPTMNLNVNGTFVSGKNYYRDYSASREQRMKQQIISNATLNKDFGGGRSVTVNFNQTRYLDTDELAETLPRINFRVGRFSLVPKPKPAKGERVETRWFHGIYANYSSEAVAQHSKTAVYETISDTVNGGSYIDTSYVDKRNMGWNHNIGVNSSQKIFGWLSVNPSVNILETWFTKRKNYFLRPDTNLIDYETENGFFARHTYNMAVSFGTKLYGIFNPWFLKNSQIRHVITPSLSFGYRPDFSDLDFEYYQAVADTSGKVYKKDRYDVGLFSNTPSGGQKSMSISVQNLFQMKIGEGEKAKKIDLFNWNLNTAYNWMSEEYRLGSISSNVRANPTRDINFSFSTIYDPYKTSADGERKSRLYLQDLSLSDPASWIKMRLGRLTNIRADLSIRIKGTLRTGGTSNIVSQEEGSLSDAVMGVLGDRLEGLEAASAAGNRWDINANFSYTENRNNPQRTVRQFYANARLNFNLTRNWRVTLQTRYDFENKEFASQDFIFYRDLHCWEAQVFWSPLGTYKRFYFRINVKSPQLQDLKFEKGTGRSGLTGSSFSSYLE